MSVLCPIFQFRKQFPDELEEKQGKMGKGIKEVRKARFI
jgi:hypothetical protein